MENKNKPMGLTELFKLVGMDEVLKERGMDINNITKNIVSANSEDSLIEELVKDIEDNIREAK